MAEGGSSPQANTVRGETMLAPEEVTAMVEQIVWAGGASGSRRSLAARATR